MKNIMRVFIRDLKNLNGNITAIIVIIGICVIPALYAWFNIAANWDPYGNTAGIKVAVANMDKGYDATELMPGRINIGDEIVSSLKDNDQIGWTFLDYDAAMEGVKRGDYYAAVIIPEDFSEKIASFLTDNIESPTIQYYVNEKKNAIAPKITDTGINALASEVNSKFISIATETIASVLSVSASELNDMGLTPIDDLMGSLKDTRDSLSILSSSLSTLVSTSDSIVCVLDSLSASLPDLDNGLNNGAHTIGDVENALINTKNLTVQLLDMADSVFGVLEDTSGLLGDIFDTIDSSSDMDLQFVIERLYHMADVEDSLASMLEQPIEILSQLAANMPENSPSRDALNNFISQLSDLSYRLSGNGERLRSVAADISGAGDIAQNHIADISSMLSSQNSQLSSIRSQFNGTVRPMMDVSFNDLMLTLDDLNYFLNGISDSVGQLDKVFDSAAAAMNAVKASLESSRQTVEKICDKLTAVVDKLDGVTADEQIQALVEILKNDPELVGDFMSSPVKIETTTLFPIKNYGSAMSPFYSVLAIWVGAIVMVAMLKVRVYPDKELGNIRPYQAYFGRYIIFMIIGLLQATFIALGDLYYLGIQCQAPFLFLLASWVISIVVTFFVYTMTVSFSDIGKAISVILLVIQIAGAGGTFPVEVLPGFFQSFYSFLPFTYAIDALRSTVAGIYAGDYVLNLLHLLVYIPVALVFGLILRKPLIKLNEFFESRLEETKLM